MLAAARKTLNSAGDVSALQPIPGTVRRVHLPPRSDGLRRPHGAALSQNRDGGWRERDGMLTEGAAMAHQSAVETPRQIVPLVVAGTEPDHCHSRVLISEALIA